MLEGNWRFFGKKNSSSDLARAACPQYLWLGETSLSLVRSARNPRSRTKGEMMIVLLAARIISLAWTGNFRIPWTGFDVYRWIFLIIVFGIYSVLRRSRQLGENLWLRSHAIQYPSETGVNKENKGNNCPRRKWRPKFARLVPTWAASHCKLGCLWSTCFSITIDQLQCKRPFSEEVRLLWKKVESHRKLNCWERATSPVSQLCYTSTDSSLVDSGNNSGFFLLDRVHDLPGNLNHMNPFGSWGIGRFLCWMEIHIPSRVLFGWYFYSMGPLQVPLLCSNPRPLAPMKFREHKSTKNIWNIRKGPTKTRIIGGRYYVLQDVPNIMECWIDQCWPYSGVPYIAQYKKKKKA